MNLKAKHFFATLAVLLGSVPGIGAQEEAPKPPEPELVPLPIEDLKRSEPVDFATEVFPILKKNCIACHSESKAKAKLVLESPDAIRKGSENGEVVRPGDSANSVLFLNSAHMEEPVMPPEKNKANAKNLTPRELALMKLWIDQGAKGEGPVKSERPLQWRPLPNGVRPVYAVSISPDGRYTAAGRGNGIDVIDNASGVLVAEVRDAKVEGGGAHLDLVGSISFADGWIASGGFREVKVWKEVRGEVKSELNLGAEVISLVASEDGSMRAAALKNGDVVSWATGKAGEKKTVKVEGGATALAISEGGETAVGSGDKKLRVFGGDGAAKWEVEVPTEAISLVFCQDGRLAGALAGDPVIRVWKTDDAAAPPQELKGHGKPVRLLGYGGEILVSAAEGGEAKIWKMPSGGAGATLNAGGEVGSMAVSEGGAHVAMAAGDGLVKVFATADGKALALPAVSASDAHAAAEAGRNLVVAKNLANTRKTQRDAALKKRDEEVKKVQPAKEALVKAETEKAAKEGPEKAAEAESAKAKESLAAAEAKGMEALKPLMDAVAKAEEAAKTASEMAKVAAEMELAKVKEALTAAEAKRDSTLKPLRDAVAKAEAMVNTEPNKAKASADAELTKAREALAAAQGAKENGLKPLRESVAKAEAAAKAAAPEARAAADAELAKAREALVAAEAKGANDLKPAQDQVKKAEEVAKTAFEKAKAAADADLVKARTALTAAEAKANGELKPVQDAVAKADAELKTAADKAKAAADAEIKKAQAALAAAEAKGKNERKTLEDAAKKAADAAKKAKDEADVARRAERGARLNSESAVRIAAREEEALKVAEEKLTAADAAVKAAEPVEVAAKKAVAEAVAGKVKMVGFTSGALVMIGEDEKARMWRPGDAMGVDELEGIPGAVGMAGAGNLGVLLTKANGEVSLLGANPKWELAKVLETGGDRVTAVDFSPGGKQIAVGTGEPSRSGSLSLWDRDSGSKIWEVEDAHSDVVAGLEFSPDGRHIATCAADRMAKVFDAAAGKLEGTFEGHTGYVAGVAWRADGLQFATAGADHDIKVWEFETGDQKKTQKGHSKEVTAVGYLGTGDNVVSASGDGSVRIANQGLPGSSGFVQCVVVDTGGKWIVSGGPDGVIRVWSAGDKKLAHDLK